MIFIDIAEPKEIVDLVKQTHPDVSIAALNQAGIADYHFASVDAHTVQVNRTQAGELLSNIDSFEDELRRYYHSAEMTYAIIEGIISPYKLSAIKTTTEISLRPLAPPGFLYTYHVTDRGFVYGEREHRVSNKMLKSWLFQIDKSGVSVIYTINYADTASTLVAFYDNLQKPEHTTLQRYIRPKIIIRSQSPHVQALINISHAYKLNIGESKAVALIDYFGCLGNVLLADRKMLQEVDGIGPSIAENLVNALGGGSDE